MTAVSMAASRRAGSCVGGPTGMGCGASAFGIAGNAVRRAEPKESSGCVRAMAGRCTGGAGRSRRTTGGVRIKREVGATGLASMSVVNSLSPGNRSAVAGGNCSGRRGLKIILMGDRGVPVVASLLVVVSSSVKSAMHNR